MHVLRLAYKRNLQCCVNLIKTPQCNPAQHPKAGPRMEHSTFGFVHEGLAGSQGFRMRQGSDEMSFVLLLDTFMKYRTLP